MTDPIRRALTKLGEYAAHPAAFGLALLYTAAWLLFDRESFDFHGATELSVLCITLFISGRSTATHKLSTQSSTNF